MVRSFPLVLTQAACDRLAGAKSWVPRKLIAGFPAAELRLGAEGEATAGS
jgi:hypothetical protein